MATDLTRDSELYIAAEERLLSSAQNIWLRLLEADWDGELTVHGVPPMAEDYGD